jgi:hypothetical protein
METIALYLGYLLIWILADVGRKEDSRVRIFSKLGILQILLMIIGMSLIEYSGAFCK